jgi:4'-phosphopantetheinyl transferase
MTDTGLIPLALERADIWLAFPDAANAPLWHAHAAVLNAQERQRMDAFKSRDARMQFLAGHALVRWALSQYAAVAPADWQFTANIHGKPTITAPQGHRALHFNLSHTHGLVACAIGPQTEIGVDVEFNQRLTDMDGVMDLVLTREERAQITAPSSPEGRDRFLALWTLKEAYIKARGLGFDLPPMDFRFDEPTSPAPRIYLSGGIDDDPGRWAFRSYPVTPDHRLSIALSGPIAHGPSIRLMRVAPTPDGGFTQQA